MNKRYKTNSAVILMLIRKNGLSEEVLLQKRKNTGYCDGYYDLSASGHVEKNESMQMALIRESYEELGIKIKMEDVEFVSLIHKGNMVGDVYYNGYFKVNKYEGEPKITEPDKNDEIKWVNINDLPNNLIDDRKIAIYNYIHNIPYTEYGWK